MVRYRRNFIAGGAYSFTVTLADRRSRALTDNIDALRIAIRKTRRTHPFSIDAIVVLPDHLHTIWTLLPEDADFQHRWSLIKRRFTDGMLKAGGQVARHRNGECALWQRRYWEHTIEMTRVLRGTSITSTLIRLNMALSRAHATGRIHRFIVM